MNIDLTCDTPPPPPAPPAPCPAGGKCDCRCFKQCGSKCGDGCYDKCAGKSGCTENCPATAEEADAAPASAVGDAAREARLSGGLAAAEGGRRQLKQQRYNTECPAPKAGIRVDDGAHSYKLLVACYDKTSRTIKGRRALFDLKVDPGERHDISAANPAVVAKLSARIIFYAKQSVTPMGHAPPWQGPGYWCAKCKPGRTTKVPGGGAPNAWQPWCSTPKDQPC